MTTNDLPSDPLPLDGVRVVEFVHTVMGPTCGMVLADLGADVIKVEQTEGDVTRHLAGSGAGYWAMYNRNKRSIALDLKTADGQRVAKDLIRTVDVMTENFGPGTIERLGLGYETVNAINPKLVFCALKGFLSGPYEHRMALDEVTQMMGGLAYMTGLPGRPMRAGSAVVDILGGTFGVVAILAALNERERTGQGQMVKSALFETTAFMIGQHMAYASVVGEPMPPMSVRLSAWCVYDVFDTADNEQIFLGLVTDNNWKRFCQEFGYDDWFADPALATNAQRVHARDRIMPAVTELFAGNTKARMMERLERASLPFAPIGRPEEMFDDPHLNVGGGLIELDIGDGKTTSLPATPVEVKGRRLGKRRGLPGIGQHTREILAELGYADAEITDLIGKGVAAG